MAALLVTAPAAAQTPASLAAAVRSGDVGERYDGYMGIAGSASPEVRRQVSAINLQRRSLYFQLAATRRVNAQVVGIATGCQLIAGLRAGQSYMLGDGAWHRLAAGQTPPSPDYCR
ncbi:MAG: YdbL family protein [Sphingomonas sp.]|nr:YdbL family protein [Sphingomonas sp.]